MISDLLESLEFALKELSFLKCNSIYEQDCHVCNAEEAIQAAIAEVKHNSPINSADAGLTVSFTE